MRIVADFLNFCLFCILLILAHWHIIGADFTFIEPDSKPIGADFCNTPNPNSFSTLKNLL